MNEPKIGDNNPPSMATTAGEVANDLSGWMANHPVIQTEAEARESKVFVDRAKLCIQDLEAERDNLVRPLNAEVQRINGHYRSPRSLLERVLDELKARLATFLRAEEQKRVQAADEARARAEEAERIAREAERVEKDRIADAAAGEIDIDVASLSRDADQAFSAYEKATRQAELAERETRVRIGGGFQRALGLKTETTLVVMDEVLALKDMGLTEYIKEAMIKSARAYKKLHGKYPQGIEAQTQRKV
jgi:hypothetical protein